MRYPLDHPFSLPAEEVVRLLDTHSDQGISGKEAERRGKTYGPNTYPAQPPKSPWLILLAQFRSPIVYLLIFGAGVSLYFNDLLETLAILAVIILNALIGFFMEMQARRSMNALKKMEVILANVIRNGEVQQVPAEVLVPGDLVPLEAGDIIPADGRLVSVHRLQCDESSLTGESLPVEKATEALPQDTVTGDRHNMVFKGAAVINGNGKMIITGIGTNTQLGAITDLVEHSAGTVTPLDIKLN